MNINASQVLNIGNTTIRFDQKNDGSKQYLSLSGAALQTVGIQAKKQQEILSHKLANSLIVPTNLHEIQLQLRLLGEPIAFFGETHSEKRARLKDSLVTLSLENRLVDFQTKLQQYYTLHENEQGKAQEQQYNEFVKRQKKSAFLVQVSNSAQVVTSRVHFLQYSLASAQLRLYKEQLLRQKLMLWLDAIRQIQYIFVKNIQYPVSQSDDNTIQNDHNPQIFHSNAENSKLGGKITSALTSTIPLSNIPIEFRTHVKLSYIKLLQQKKLKETRAIASKTASRTAAKDIKTEQNDDTFATPSSTSQIVPFSSLDSISSINTVDNAYNPFLALFGEDDVIGDGFDQNNSISAPSLFDDFFAQQPTSNSSINTFDDLFAMNASTTIPNSTPTSTNYDPSSLSSSTLSTLTTPTVPTTLSITTTTTHPKFLKHISKEDQLLLVSESTPDTDYEIPTYLYWQEKLSPTLPQNNRRTYSTHHLQKMHQLRNLQPKSTYKADTRVISCSTVSNASQRLITGSWSGHLKVWDLTKVAQQRNTMSPSQIFVGHTGRIIDVITPYASSWCNELNPLMNSNTGYESISAISSGTDGIYLWPNLISLHDDDDDIDEEARDVANERGQNVKVEVNNPMTTNSIQQQPQPHSDDDDNDDDNNMNYDERQKQISNDMILKYQQEQRQFQQSIKISPITRINTGTSSTTHVSKIAIHPTNQYLFAASHDHTVKCYDIETGQLVLNQYGHSTVTKTVSIHQDGSILCSGDLGGNARLWDLRTGRSLLTLEGHANSILCSQFGKNEFSHIIATGSSDNTVKLWDLRIRKCIYTIPLHKKHVVDVSFDSTGQFLASASFDNTIGLFSLPTMSIIGQFKGHLGKVTRVNWWDQNVVSTTKNTRLASDMNDIPDNTNNISSCFSDPSKQTTFNLWDDEDANLLSPHFASNIITSSFDTTFKVW